VICPEEAPLLGFLSMVLPLVVAGNCVIAVPSAAYPLIAGDLYQVFETSDVPGGVINMVTGRPAELMKVLADHDDVDTLWCYGDEELCAAAKRLSAGNLKQVWTNEGRRIDFFHERYGAGRWYSTTPVRSRISGCRTASERSASVCRRGRLQQTDGQALEPRNVDVETTVTGRSPVRDPRRQPSSAYCRNLR